MAERRGVNIENMRKDVAQEIFHNTDFIVYMGNYFSSEEYQLYCVVDIKSTKCDCIAHRAYNVFLLK